MRTCAVRDSSGPICPATFQYISLGMSRAEVHAVIGVPPVKDDVRLGEVPRCGNARYFQLHWAEGTSWENVLEAKRRSENVASDSWDGERYRIVVIYDQEDTVAARYFFEIHMPFETPLPQVRKILLWLGW